MLFELEQNHIAIGLWKLNIPYYQLLKQIRPLNTSTVCNSEKNENCWTRRNKQTNNKHVLRFDAGEKFNQ